MATRPRGLGALLLLPQFLAWTALSAAPALSAPRGASDPLTAPRVQVDLLSEWERPPAGREFHIALRFRIDPEWHIYWKNPGDSGREPRLKWAKAPGAEIGSISWPMPRRFELPPLANYGYEGEAILPIPVKIAAPGLRRLRLDLDWLVCRVECIPGKGSLEIRLPVMPEGQEVASLEHAERIRRALARVPAPPPAGVQARFSWDSDTLAVAITDGGTGAWARAERAEFFPDDGTLWLHGEEPDSSFSRAEASAEAPANGNRPQAPEAVRGVWVFHAPKDSGLEPWAFEVEAKPGARPSGLRGLGILAIFAFIGGLLLNLMPCVLPVLTLKALGFVAKAKAKPAELRAQGWAYTAGVTLSFLVLAGLLLALRAGGERLGWGFQLQSPAFVAALALLFFLLGLNLLGAFEIGTRLMGLAGAGGSGLGAKTESFLTGALATLAATPCTAPFMGAALGAAITRPAHEALLLFTSLGLGMAAPYLLLAHLPGAVKALPKPGLWMERLKQFFAFPLFATAAWLCWVLAALAGPTGVGALLAALVLAGYGVWIGRPLHGSAAKQESEARVFLKRSLALASLLGAFGLALAAGAGGPVSSGTVPGSGAQIHAGGPWSAWSAEETRTLLGAGKPVFVDFTAAWCLTCQVNKRLVLRQPHIEAAFARSGVELRVADWTASDPRITSELESLGRTGVPAYALYLPGGGRPRLLPEILTESLVLTALREIQKN
ncbi:MAG: thioredoxin family protein [Bdellovibrionales bacterium]|nr:thioredoxin family protein [Bdellovibrionales bacterium]